MVIDLIDLCSDEDEERDLDLAQGGVDKDRAQVLRRLPLHTISNENIVLNLSQQESLDNPNLSEEVSSSDGSHIHSLPPPRGRGTGRRAALDDPPNNGNKRKARQISSEEARAAKIASKVQLQQRHGYYKHQELSLVVEQKLFDSELGGEIGSHLLFSSEKAYGYLSMQSSISGLCQWTYRSYLDGGHGLSGEVGVVPLPFVAIVFPPQRLIQLALQSPDNGLTFPEYSTQLEGIRSQLTFHCPPRPSQQGGTKVCLIIIDLQEECVLFQRSQRQMTPFLTQRIDDLIAYSLYTEDVEVTCRKNSSECCLYLEALTRVMGEQLYAAEKSSLDTFKR
jgi:hypothetical protein